MSHMNPALSNRDMVAVLADASQNPKLTVARVEIKQGGITRSHSHERECMIVVVQGAWRFCLGEHTVIVTANEMLRIPAGQEHTSEALSDTVALSISSAPGDWSACYRFLHDPDQYLWGV